jgi:DNA-binding MarR family transcriptional regulator
VIDERSLDLPVGGLLASIVRLNLLVTDVLEAIAGRDGIAFADYLVLGVVRRSPDGRSSPSAIAETLGRTTGGMSLALGRLESAGWVVRTPDASDGRRVVVELTRRGADLARSVNDELHRWEETVAPPAGSAETVALLDELTAAVSQPAGTT